MESTAKCKRIWSFFVSCIISRLRDSRLISIPNREAWTMVDFDCAMNFARNFETSKNLGSHHLFGAEYDSILKLYTE